MERKVRVGITVSHRRKERARRLASRALCVPGMGTVLMGFKSPVYKPEIMKMNTKIPAEVKELRVIAALKEPTTGRQPAARLPHRAYAST